MIQCQSATFMTVEKNSIDENLLSTGSDFEVAQIFIFFVRCVLA